MVDYDSVLRQSSDVAASIATEAMPRIVHVADLPSAENMIRKRDIEVNSFRARTGRPPPILFDELGLVVKYGSAITIAEGQCLWYFNRYMKDTVPTPELYGWCRDEGETFIYMEYIDGDTLEDAWPALSPEDLDLICEQLRKCVEAWRNLRQETEPYFVGHIGRQEVGDIILSNAKRPGDPPAGPFENLTKFHDYFARYACRRHPEWNPRTKFPELAGLTDDRPVVFTHADLDKSNIIVTPREGESPPRVAAIIDWHQSGWYPSGWEWLKAQALCEPSWEGERDTAWLSKIMTPVDHEYLVAWDFINHTLGY
ncbi:kinase-like domain-containing protein [Hypoxylon sp. FL1150]|nr:kinase-like domain-containing protein [Hypoxylon sp. FL1150]